MHVATLTVFPVKSTRAHPVLTTTVHAHGLGGDRRWALVDGSGAVVTARTRDRMLLIAATPTATGLRLSAPGRAELDVEFPVDGDVVPVGVSRMPRARYAGRAASEWCSTVLGEHVALVWQSDPRARTVSAEHGGRDGDHMSLADAGPLLVATTASVARLNEWIAETDRDATIPITRFRPNVVVDDDSAGALEPFEEDGWARIRIGGVSYRFAEQCDRCVLTTIDPDTLAHGKEPLRTLARHRKRAGKTWFAVRMIPERSGVISVGDRVEVLERQPVAAG
ncbi:MOSC domain-containing protein [Microbacterium horticulturae]|uniref:MOSC domain-containing protein n=1 Tax=Microbacterium horticulturae TaxID=3028316 RepID=A0ABY8C431_9MICO|nr:MOSC N-terminal beta barrel domain-containing protein [Microbacterium sp. KACC 23027]WEG09598.1 MOSC domain-containing protein [Microbacterium sp. KACC 23027]